MSWFKSAKEEYLEKRCKDLERDLKDAQQRVNDLLERLLLKHGAPAPATLGKPEDLLGMDIFEDIEEERREHQVDVSA